jgi:alkyl hydroperoxide reductase subunit AhpC
MESTMSIGVGSAVPDISVPAHVPGTDLPARMSLRGGEPTWSVLVISPSDILLRAFAERQDEYAAAGIRLIAIGVDNTPDEVSFPVVESHALRATFGASGTYVVDPEGIVRHAGAGRSPGSTLRTVAVLQRQPYGAVLDLAA